MIDRVQCIDVDLNRDETIYITPLADLHLDSPLCDYDTLAAILKDRHKRLPNHRVIITGDTSDLILPVDLRRHRQSLNIITSGQDEFLMDRIKFVVGRLRGLGCKIDLVGEGNHEHSVVKYHGVDPTTLYASELGAIRGGYHGTLNYRLHYKGKHRVNYTIDYHHGAWGGEYAKGYLGAQRWFMQSEGWDLAVYGHNHATRFDPETRFRQLPNSYRRVECIVRMVNVGSWSERGHKDARLTSHADLKGHRAHPRIAFLVRVTLRRKRSNLAAGLPEFYFDHTVEG